MHFGDERYVRLYTRDTLTWLSLGWEGQAALALLMRKVDRAGVLEIDDRTAEEAVAAITGLPLPICTAAWSRLSTGIDPVVTLRDETSRALVIPRFLEAQEAIATDKARAQKARETRRAVTRRDEPSQSVTKRHARSRGVTPSRAVPSCAVPSHTEDLDHERSADPVAHAPGFDTPRNKSCQGQLRDPWPADVLEQLRQALGRVQPAELDQAWCGFVTLSMQHPVAARVAAAREYLSRRHQHGEHDPKYVLAMIANGAGSPRGRNGVALPAAAPPQTRWQKAGFKTEGEYLAKVRELAEARGGTDQAYADAVQEVLHAG